MRSKLSVVLFTAFLVAVFLSASLVYAADSKHPRTTFKLDRAPKFMIPFERGPHDMTPGPTPLNTPAQKYPFVPPGSKVGTSTYDYQHNGSMGRMCAEDAINNQMIFVWMAQTNATIPGDRLIRFQVVDLATGDNLVAGDGQIATPGDDYAGYTSAASMPDGVYGGVSFAAHYDRTSGDGTGLFQSIYGWDASVFAGFPLYIWNYGNMGWSEHPEWEVIWPIVTTQFKGTGGNPPTEDVVYLLSHVGPDDPSEAMVLYRRVGSLADTAIHFDSGQYIDLCTDLSYIIIADPNSDHVAIVYTSDRAGLEPGAGGQTDMDVYYRLSTDQGETWGDPVDVSNYTEDSLWRAYTDLSAVYTGDGVLHVIWNARELRDANTYENYKCRLVHWDDLNEQTSIIDEARYTMQVGDIPCDPGAWNMYIAKMSLSECDGKMYALYTKFGDDNEPGALYDCSHAHMANGELYLAGSDDGGQTWDTAWNLTKTRTPACDSNDCMSEHWSSMAMFGIAYGDETVKDTLDIQYIYDRDAGGIPQGEGTWCVNDVMHYRFQCRDVAHIPRPSYEPNNFNDPLHTPPGTPLTVTLKVLNIGNAELDISSITPQYSTGANWIQVGAPSVNPIPLQGFATYDITFNYNSDLVTDPSGWDAVLRVDHNGPTDFDDLPVHLTVASDFNLPQFDTLRATTKKLMVYNTGRLGGDNDGASLDIPGDCDDDLTTPNAKIYLYDASPMITYDDGGTKKAYTTVFTQLFTEQGTFRPQSELNFITTADYNEAVCTLSTTDSLFGVGVELYAPIDGGDFVIAKYSFTTWKPGLKGTDQVNVGFVADWDIPSDRAVDNGSGFDDTAFTIWQIGREVDTLVDDEDPPHSCPITEDQRYGGIRVISGNVKTAWTAENAPMQVASGFSRDSLYARMTAAAGYHLSATLDTIDLHTGICFAQVDLSAKTTYTYVVALATSNTGLASMTTQLAAAYDWAVEHEIYNPDCCVTAGDANRDGGVNVGDAVFLITYIFKDGPPPPCLNEGDANGDCGINVGDAVYLITYIFKDGPPPVCGCVPPPQ